jgi:hypothetical protein
MRKLIFAAALALAACHPSVPEPGAPTDGMPADSAPPPDVPPDTPPPVEPPTTAMETMAGAGALSAPGGYTLDVQLGGMTRAQAASADDTLDTSPVLH